MLRMFSFSHMEKAGSVTASISLERADIQVLQDFELDL